jgi:hypothetical protein
MNISRTGGLGLLGFVLACSSVHADLSISNKPTQNMSCEAGVCTATAKKAVLNVSELTNLLASGDVAVKTGSAAKDIDIDQPLTWASLSRLTLDAQQSVAVKKSVTITGTGALTIITNDGGKHGEFIIVPEHGSVQFWDLASSIVIDGKAFTLIASIAALADAVHKNPSGKYALAKNYDATVDGTYNQAPISRDFRGTFEGLGNKISGLSIDNGNAFSSVALFASLASPGAIRNIGLSKLNITSLGGSYSSIVAGLVAQNGGTIAHSFVAGSVKAGSSITAGGLAGNSTGSIADSYADVFIRIAGAPIVGGLVGENAGGIRDSYSSGDVKAGGHGYAAGFVGVNHSSSTITRSRSTGTVSGGQEAIIGSFVSSNSGVISQSFALGPVPKAGRGGVEGGFCGFNANGAAIAQSYSRGDSYGSGGDKDIDEAHGGFVGHNLGTITQSYSTGAPSTGDKGKSFIGGLIGVDDAASGSLANTYWDLDTSGISDPHRGAGNTPDDPGIVGLTDVQLKSALPQGFDPKMWGSDPNINNGYPYLLTNPPQ